MTQKTNLSLDAIDTALAKATPDLGEAEQRLVVAVLRRLAAGQPVGVPAAAAAGRAARRGGGSELRPSRRGCLQ